MRANPGGQIAAPDVVWRDDLISSLWRSLEGRSLVLTAERRMGKTSIIRKMIAEYPRGVLPIYRDLEGIHAPAEFAEVVFLDVEHYLSTLHRTAAGTKRLLAHLSGAELGEFLKFPEAVSPHWKTLLARTVEDLVEDQDRTVIFFWDELPMMLDNIKKRCGEVVAMEVLDALRSLRQTHTSLRMVFTGSISLHNAIAGLRSSGYANDPTNDMDNVEVPPLSTSCARTLVLELFKGEGINFDKAEDVADEIARSVDGLPYFIQHVVNQMASRRDNSDGFSVDDLVNDSIATPSDPWHLRHYVERLGSYYTPRNRNLALLVLDLLATSDAALRFDEILKLIKAQRRVESPEVVREVLLLLARDHYLTNEGTGLYVFRYPLIKRWWRIHRG